MAEGNGEAKHIPPRIVVEWDDEGQKHFAMEGNVTTDHLAVAAFLINDVAHGLLQAQMANAINAGAAASPIIPIRGKLADAKRI